MQSVSDESLESIGTLLEENEGLRAQLERMTDELNKCRECRSHFKWVIKRQRQQLERFQTDSHEKTRGNV